MHRVVAAALGAAVLFCAVLALDTAQAAVLVVVDRASQQMSVEVDGQARYSWPVSTGKRGFGTPAGTFRPQRMARTWFSRTYYNSPMPYSIFFHGGYAIHGTNYLTQLGGPASHGCVRLHPANAATLFSLVQREGASRTRIVIN
jgi:lipoprotein-anchoring transpeptidase ErfK/SrfK